MKDSILDLAWFFFIVFGGIPSIIVLSCSVGDYIISKIKK